MMPMRSARAPQLLADLRVERAEGLVEQQHLRLVRERTRDRDALLLSARELARQAVVHAFERHEAQQLLAALATLRGFHAAHAQRELDVLADRHVPEQRVALEHEADLALAHGELRHVAAVQADASVIDTGESGDRSQERALAAAARPQQDEELPVGYLEGDVVHDRSIAIAFCYLI
jgi:hypothetical protein